LASQPAVLPLKCHALPFDPEGHGRKQMGGNVTRALRNQGLWLALAYVGLLLLMARAYA